MKLELSLFRLEVFMAVVDRGGYSAAAFHLGLSQPSVSYHIRALEEMLGAQVVVYRDRGIHLTPEGEELYRTAKSMLRDAERLSQAIEEIRTGQRGSLSVGASIAFEHKFFFDSVVGPFLHSHPDVDISLEFGHSTKLVEMVADGELDLAYVNDWALPAGVRYEPLHISDLVFWVSRDHPLADSGEVTTAQIAGAGLITAPTAEAEWHAYYGLLRSAGIRDPRIAAEIDGVQARKLATEAGLGVFGTFLPHYAGPEMMAPLVPLQLSIEAPTIEFGLVTPADRGPTMIMSDFADWLRKVAE